MRARVLTLRRSGLLARLLALALLFGQFGAETHAYSHLADDPHGLPDTTQVCRACASFAPLASAVGGQAVTTHIERCSSEAPVPKESAATALDPHYPGFRSRAPPAIL